MKNLLTLLLVSLMALSSCKKDDENDIVYKESFNDRGSWYFDDSEEYSCKVNEGKYEMIVNVPDYYGYSIVPSIDITYDYSVSVDCSLILEDSTKDGIMGINYNYFDDAFYTEFIITKNGYFAVVKKEGLKHTTLLSSSVDKSILGTSGEIYHLEVIQRSNSTEFKVNHITVGTLSYGRNYPKVKAGLMVYSVGEPYFTRMKAVFDNFIIRKL